MIVSDSVHLRPHTEHKEMIHIKTNFEMQEPEEAGEWS